MITQLLKENATPLSTIKANRGGKKKLKSLHKYNAIPIGKERERDRQRERKRQRERETETEGFSLAISVSEKTPK